MDIIPVPMQCFSKCSKSSKWFKQTNPTTTKQKQLSFLLWDPPVIRGGEKVVLSDCNIIPRACVPQDLVWEKWENSVFPTGFSEIRTKACIMPSETRQGFKWREVLQSFPVVVDFWVWETSREARIFVQFLLLFK